MTGYSIGGNSGYKQERSKTDTAGYLNDTWSDVSGIGDIGKASKRVTDALS